MGNIFILMGKSSTGKDTIYRELLQRERLGLRRIVIYTTRPKRGSEHEGVEYHFTDEAAEERLRSEGRLIESRSYDTVHGRWDYFMADDGQVSADGDYLLIGTLDSYESLRRYYSDIRIVPIYIEVEDGSRLERALMRERNQPHPRYEEMCRRFLADNVDFSQERLAAAGVTDEYIFYNSAIDETVDAIEAFIYGQQ